MLQFFSCGTINAEVNLIDCLMLHLHVFKPLHVCCYFFFQLNPERQNNHHCTSDADCAGTACSGQDYYCQDHKCFCHDHNHGSKLIIKRVKT